MNIVFDIPPALIIGLLVSAVLPLLVGLVTKKITHPGVRATLLAGLAAVTGLLTELLNAVNANVSYNLGTGIVLAFTSFIVAVGMHFGIYKPTGASAAAISVGDSKTPPVFKEK